MPSREYEGGRVCGSCGRTENYHLASTILYLIEQDTHVSYPENSFRNIMIRPPEIKHRKIYFRDGLEYHMQSLQNGC